MQQIPVPLTVTRMLARKRHDLMFGTSAFKAVVVVALLFASNANAFNAKEEIALPANRGGSQLQRNNARVQRAIGNVHARAGGRNLGYPVSTYLATKELRGGSVDFRKAKQTLVSTLAAAWKHPSVQAAAALVVASATPVLRDVKSLTYIQQGMVVSAFLAGIKIGKMETSFKRYCDVSDIPSRYFGAKAPCMSGRVASVSDGDTLRIYHTPTRFHTSKLLKTQKLSEHTLPIRVCTIDTPETEKFGKPGQPFGKEAKAELQRLVENKRVKVRLLSKDQYGRAVGQVFAPRWFSRQCVDEILLKAGLAEVYQGMGAVYGPRGKEYYLALEDKARKARKGIWSQSKRESAADYKKRMK